MKQQLAKAIIEKALKEMRERQREMFKKGVFGLCMKIYDKSGKAIHEFNVMQRELHEPKEDKQWNGEEEINQIDTFK